MRKLLILGIVSAAIAVFIVLSGMRPEPPKRERVVLDPLVEVIELEAAAFDFSIESQGTVEPRTQTVLSAEVVGTVTEISPKFVAGGVFRAGEVLLRIDPTNYTVAVEQAEAVVTQRQIEFDGASKLRNQGYRAESDYASAVAALAAARAELVRARRDLERTAIRVPYAGIVRAKEADIGQFVSPGTRLGVVFATDVAEVRLPLTDKDLAFVALPGLAAAGDQAAGSGPAVRLSALQKGKRAQWSARIARSEGVVDASSRVTYAVAEIIDPYGLESGAAPLPVGTFVTAYIDGANAEGLLRVPRRVIRGSDQLMFVDAENRIEIRTVDIIRSDARYAYIGSGAAPGDRVVLTVIETPVNGMAVRTGGASDGAP